MRRCTDRNDRRADASRDPPGGGSGMRETCRRVSPDPLLPPRPPGLRAGVPAGRLRGHRANRGRAIRSRPPRWQAGPHVRELSPQIPPGESLGLAGNPGRRLTQMSLHQQAHAIRHDLHRHYRPPTAGGLRADQLRTAGRNRAANHWGAIPRASLHLMPQVANTTSGNQHLPGHASDYTNSLCQTTPFPRRPNTAIPSRGA